MNAQSTGESPAVNTRDPSSKPEEVAGKPQLTEDMASISVKMDRILARMTKLEEILPRCDVINMLRIQFERQRSGLFPSIHEYARLFGMNNDRLRLAKRDILLLAPGPINRGVEITPDVADGPHSAILQQVTNGLAIRMAVLNLLCGQTKPEE